MVGTEPGREHDATGSVLSVATQRADVKACKGDVDVSVRRHIAAVTRLVSHSLLIILIALRKGCIDVRHPTEIVRLVQLQSHKVRDRVTDSSTCPSQSTVCRYRGLQADLRRGNQRVDDRAVKTVAVRVAAPLCQRHLYVALTGIASSRRGSVCNLNTATG